MTRWRASLILSIVAVALTCAGAEVFLRVFRPVEYMAPPELADDVWRGLLHRQSTVPGLAYELVPGAQGFAQGADIAINSLGMRDGEPLDDDTPGLVRIVAIGDSFTFGFSVESEATYPKFLERALRSMAGPNGPTFEVLNMGVGGYSTADEALVLEYKAMPLRPRLVLVQYFLNDPDTDPVQPLPAFFHETRWWQHSHLLRLIAEAKQAREVESLGAGDYYSALHSPNGTKWKQVEDSFRHMHEVTRSGPPVLLVIFPEIPRHRWESYGYADIHRQVAAAARSAGLDVLDLLAAFSSQSPASLRVARGDSHLSPLGNAVAARAIHGKLLSDYAPLLGLE